MRQKPTIPAFRLNSKITKRFHKFKNPKLLKNIVFDFFLNSEVNLSHGTVSRVLNKQVPSSYYPRKTPLLKKISIAKLDLYLHTWLESGTASMEKKRSYEP